MDTFKKEVTISDADLGDFVSFAKKRDISVRIRSYRDVYKNYIKAVMAEQLFNNNVYEQMLNENDPVIKKVLEIDKK